MKNQKLSCALELLVKETHKQKVCGDVNFENIDKSSHWKNFSEPEI